MENKNGFVIRLNGLLLFGHEPSFVKRINFMKNGIVLDQILNCKKHRYNDKAIVRGISIRYIAIDEF